MEMPKILVIVRDDAESSIYRLARSKKQFNYEEFQAHLIKTFNVRVSEVGAILNAAYEDAIKQIAGATPEYYIPKLPTDVVELFKCFRWHSSEDGTSSIYVQSGPNSTFVLTIDPMKTASALSIGGNQSLEDYMIEEYLRLARQGLLPFVDDKQTNDQGEVKSGPVMLPTLSEYWEEHIKKIWASDSRFRLPHRPVEISTDPQKPSFFFWDSSKIHKGPHPAWDRWMNVIPVHARPVFMAWIASIVDPQNKGRQALWTQDQGYSGKSTVMRVLAKFLGPHAVGAISKDSFSDKFSYASIYGRRLVVYGDNKNPKLLHHEKIHSVLGGDIVQIERKNVQPFSAEIHAKLWISANCLPEVDLGSRSETTRVIPITLQEPPEEVLAAYCKTDSQGRVVRQKDGSPVYIGGNLEEQLLPEMPAFLYSCNEHYLALCPNRMDIVLSEEMWESMQLHCPSPEHLNLERFLEQELEFGPEFTVRPEELQEVFNSWSKGRANQFDYSRLGTFLRNKRGCEVKRIQGKRMYLGVRIQSVTNTRKLKL